MGLFRRDGRPIEVADAGERVQSLNERKTTAGARVAELTAEIAELGEECRVCLLEARFDDHQAAAERVTVAEAELSRAQTELHALEAAELEVSRERQLREWQSRVAECESVQAEIGDRIQRKLAELPLLVQAAQELAADLLGEEQAFRSAAHEAASLRHQIKFRDEPQLPGLPRLAVSSPVSAVFERHPEFRALANRAWFTGVAGGSR